MRSRSYQRARSCSGRGARRRARGRAAERARPGARARPAVARTRVGAPGHDLARPSGRHSSAAPASSSCSTTRTTGPRRAPPCGCSSPAPRDGQDATPGRARAARAGGRRDRRRRTGPARGRPRGARRCSSCSTTCSGLRRGPRPALGGADARSAPGTRGRRPASGTTSPPSRPTSSADLFPDRLPLAPLSAAEVTAAGGALRASGPTSPRRSRRPRSSRPTGVPLHVHAAASRYGERLFAERIGTSAQAIPDPRRRLAQSRAEVADGVTELARLRSLRQAHAGPDDRATPVPVQGAGVLRRRRRAVLRGTGASRGPAGGSARGRAAARRRGCVGQREVVGRASRPRGGDQRGAASRAASGGASW